MLARQTSGVLATTGRDWLNDNLYYLEQLCSWQEQRRIGPDERGLHLYTGIDLPDAVGFIIIATHYRLFTYSFTSAMSSNLNAN